MELSTIFLIVASLLIVLWTYGLHKKIKREKENYCAPSQIVTRLKCKCGQTKMKTFFPYEYVGEQSKIRCRKCATFMYVDAIYIEYNKSIAQQKWEAEVGKWR